MKKRLLLLACLLSGFYFLNAQNTETLPQRYIEVTGSSEIEIEPDEIVFIIRIKEYWQEEFEKRAKEEDYKTKIPIAYIERQLLSDLEKAGIDKKNITVQEVGDHWRQKGKDFLISKQFEIRSENLETIDKIIRSINTNAVDYMQIGRLNHKDMANFRKQAKIQALQAAKEKARYLLEGIGEQLGDIISVTEPKEYPFTPDYAQSMVSNTSSSFSGSGTTDNIRKIKLRYEMTARFRIR